MSSDTVEGDGPQSVRQGGEDVRTPGSDGGDERAVCLRRTSGGSLTTVDPPINFIKSSNKSLSIRSSRKSVPNSQRDPKKTTRKFTARPPARAERPDNEDVQAQVSSGGFFLSRNACPCIKSSRLSSHGGGRNATQSTQPLFWPIPARERTAVGGGWRDRRPPPARCSQWRCADACICQRGATCKVNPTRLPLRGRSACFRRPRPGGGYRGGGAAVRFFSPTVCHAHAQARTRGSARARTPDPHLGVHSPPPPAAGGPAVPSL